MLPERLLVSFLSAAWHRERGTGWDLGSLDSTTRPPLLTRTPYKMGVAVVLRTQVVTESELLLLRPRYFVNQKVTYRYLLMEVVFFHRWAPTNALVVS